MVPFVGPLTLSRAPFDWEDDDKRPRINEVRPWGFSDSFTSFFSLWHAGDITVTGYSSCPLVCAF